MLPSGSGRFQTTQWSLVAAAANSGASADAALEELCGAYWRPLYEYARRRGQTAEDAADSTQAFFVRLLDKNYLKAADQERGRFRTFLLTVFQRFLCNESDRAAAIRRGGDKVLVSMDAAECESYLSTQAADRLTPEQAFERRWAMTLLSRVLDQLQQEMLERGRPELFEKTRDCLLGEPSKSYAAIGCELNMTEAAVKVAVHRMRQRYRELLLYEVGQTLVSSDDIDDEIRHLLSVVGS